MHHVETPIAPHQARRVGRLAGLLFIATFITSIPALLLYGPVLNDPRYVVGSGSDHQIFLGATLELLLIAANIATAVVLYPVLQRQNTSLALGFVTARLMECAFIAIGVLSVLAVVSLRQTGSGDAGTLVVVGSALDPVRANQARMTNTLPAVFIPSLSPAHPGIASSLRPSHRIRPATTGASGLPRSWPGVGEVRLAAQLLFRAPP